MFLIENKTRNINFAFKVCAIVIIACMILSFTVSAATVDNGVARNVKSVLKGNIVMMIGEDKAFVNKEGKTMDKAPYIEKDMIYISSKFVSENMGDHTLATQEILPLDEACLKYNKKSTYKDGIIVLSNKNKTINLSSLSQTTIDTIKLLYAVYVAPNGDDKNVGTKEKPLKTLESDREKIKSLTLNGLLLSGGLRVYVREGSYKFIKDSFTLGAGDSGREDAPIIYSAYPGEKISFIGGVEVDMSGVAKVTDKEILNRLPKESSANIVQVDLGKQGLTSFGDVVSLSEWNNDPSMTEVFFNDKVMTISRWPNDGYVLTGEVVDSGTASGFAIDPPGYNGRGGTFKYSDLRHERWGAAKEIWLHGYWYFDWADKPVKVSVNTAKKEIKHLASNAYGIGTKKRYYAFNLLEEIDMPGEWFIDKDKSILYFYPPASLENSKLEISTLTTPIINFNRASNIIFEGMTIGVCRLNAIEINSSQNVLIRNCTIRNVGRLAVKITDGTKNGVSSCDIYETGMGGIQITAGDRANLIPGENFAENNKIHRYSRNIKTMSYGVRLQGVGNRASHNMIYDAPHMAIYFDGNDHIMEYNEMYNVVKESIDAGAVYAGRDYTNRGNIFRYNYLHDINSVVDDAGGTTVNGFYLDDALSSCAVYGNIFYNVKRAMLIGGGNDNILENNIFIDNPATILIDDRGMNWMKGDLGPGGTVYGRLYAMPFTNALWRNKYPKLADILKTELGVPIGNSFSGNLVYNSGEIEFLNGVKKDINKLANNYETKDDPGFVDLKNKNFNLKEDSIAFSKIKNFKGLPFDEMGLYKDNYGTSELKLGDFDSLFPIDGQNKVNNKNVTLRWGICEGADLYKIQIAEDKDFKNIVEDKSVAYSSFQATSLDFNKTYYWRVGGYTISKLSKDAIKMCDSVKSFSTSKTEIINKTPLYQAISETKDLLAVANANATGDAEEKKDIETVSNALLGVQNLFAKRNLKQSDIDVAIENVNQAKDKYYKSRTYGTVDMADLLKDEKGWDMTPGIGQFANGKLMFADPDGKKKNVLGYTNKISVDKALKFKLTVNLEKGFQGFAIRSKFYDRPTWVDGNSGYLVVIKNEQFELQKQKDGHKMLEIKPNNGIIETNKEYIVEFGAVNIGKMVKLVFKIDGKVIFDFMDEEVPLKDEGYFVAYEFASPTVSGAMMTFGSN